MLRIDVPDLGQGALAAAARFHAEVLPGLPQGEDLLLVFPPADHDHQGWRLSVVQAMAREWAPRRVNGVSSVSEAAIAATLAWLAEAPGVTGHYWLLDAEGASAA
jgi:hypothetical protein